MSFSETKDILSRLNLKKPDLISKLKKNKVVSVYMKKSLYLGIKSCYNQSIIQ
jgi:hypothetical protein